MLLFGKTFGKNNELIVDLLIWCNMCNCCNICFALWNVQYQFRAHTCNTPSPSSIQNGICNSEKSTFRCFILYQYSFSGSIIDSVLGCFTLHLFWIELHPINHLCPWVVWGHKKNFSVIDSKLKFRERFLCSTLFTWEKGPK